MIKKGLVTVLAEKTQKELSIDITKLSPYSNEKVYMECSRCGEIYLREYANINQLHNCKNIDIDDYNSIAIDLKNIPDDKLKELNSFINLINYINETPIRLEAKLIHPDAKLPFRKRITDAGHDIYSIEDVVIKAHDMIDVRTGLIVSAPSGYYITVDGRSGMSLHGVMPFRGIIDSGYCGEMKVALMNVSNKDYHVKKHDRIAQIILHKHYQFDVTEVENFSKDYNTRGDVGFGFSGR
jgi:dUTP pyrophosphatase